MTSSQAAPLAPIYPLLSSFYRRALDVLDNMTNPVPAGQTYHHKFPLDDTFYGMDPEDSQFLKERTGIFDDSALKEHIMNVAKNGYVVRKCYCLSPISKDESEH